LSISIYFFDDFESACLKNRSPVNKTARLLFSFSLCNSAAPRSPSVLLLVKSTEFISWVVVIRQFESSTSFSGIWPDLISCAASSISIMETDWRWTGPRQPWESPDPAVYNVIRQYMAINVAKTRFDYSMNNLLRHERVRSPFSMLSFPFHCIPSISFLCLFPSSLAFYPSWTSHPLSFTLSF